MRHHISVMIRFATNLSRSVTNLSISLTFVKNYTKTVEHSHKHLSSRLPLIVEIIQNCPALSQIYQALSKSYFQTLLCLNLSSSLTWWCPRVLYPGVLPHREDCASCRETSPEAPPWCSYVWALWEISCKKKQKKKTARVEQS